MTPININSLTLEQAESLAYREIVKRDTAIQNIQILNQIIAQRSKDSNLTENMVQPEKEVANVEG